MESPFSNVKLNGLRAKGKNIESSSNGSRRNKKTHQYSEVLKGIKRYFEETEWTLNELNEHWVKSSFGANNSVTRLCCLSCLFNKLYLACVDVLSALVSSSHGMKSYLFPLTMKFQSVLLQIRLELLISLLNQLIKLIHHIFKMLEQLHHIW